ISASNLSRRIEMPELESELGALATVLNNTFSRLEAAFQQQIRFTADASHELRTPVSIIHAQTQLALSRDRSPGEYREMLETCRRGAGRMKDLVNSLLLLAAADAGKLVPSRTLVDLRRLISECTELVAALAMEKGVAVETHLQPVQMALDASMIAQV